MSMTMTIYSLSDGNISKLLNEPTLIWRFLEPDTPEFYYHATGMGKKPGIIGKLLGKKTIPIPESLPQVLLGKKEGKECYLDKAWGGIHYLLTGSVWEGEEPLSFLLCSGDPIGHVDVGYGPARVIKASETAKICAAINLIDAQKLMSRFNPKEMSKVDVYPNIWESEKEEAFEYCLESFDSLKDHLNEAVSSDLGILIRMC